jgi:hypothetical protein
VSADQTLDEFEEKCELLDNMASPSVLERDQNGAYIYKWLERKEAKDHSGGGSWEKALRVEN